MLFNSLDFLLFLVIAFGCFFSLPIKYRSHFMLLASIAFYSFWSFKYLGLISLCVLVNYGAAILIEGSKTLAMKRAYLAISVSLSLALLLFYKYFNFFAESATSVASLVGIEIKLPSMNLILPVGISFYTFHILSYTIDVYRQKIRADKNLATISLYALFFPQLVAGPIARASHLLPQFRTPAHFDFAKTMSGLQLALWGLFKKVVIADRLALYVDPIFNHPHDHSGAQLLMASYFFAFQIYCDFSGYTDIALGLSRIFNIELMLNFKRPYLATSIHDFWKRWHISLSTWFRDYLYIPLGGNRAGARRRMVNIFIVFLVSGLWHGANWTFVCWGLVHGLGYLISMPLEGKLTQKWGGVGTIAETFITFNLVTLAWIFFRANSVEDAFYILSHLSFSLSPGTDIFASIGSTEFLYSISAILFLWLADFALEKDLIAKSKFCQSFPARVTYAYVLLFMVIVFGVVGGGQFIYFQF